MADPELDHGFVFDDQRLIDIHRSTFFDIDLENDHSVKEPSQPLLINENLSFSGNSLLNPDKDGDDGMKSGNCSNRAESSPLTDTSKSLVLVNYFPTIPIEATTCMHNSEELINMLHTCYAAASNRWANFVAVDFYKRSEGGGAFQATDMLNGRLLCGCDDVHACAETG